MNYNIKRLTISALFTALIIVGTFIKIPTGLIPITMQLPVVILTGMLLGSHWGSLSILTFIFLGLLGIPVFTGGGGLSYFLSPTFGYIYGFLIGTYLSGKLLAGKANPTYSQLAIAGLINMFIVYVFGAIHLAVNVVYVSGKSFGGIMWLIETAFGLFFFKDIIFVFIAAALAYRLRPQLCKYADFSK